MCSHLCPCSASFFLLAVWSRLWDLQVLWGHKHYRVPHLCPFRHRLVAVSSLHFFLSPSLLLFFFLGASGTGYSSWLFVVARWQRILLASHLFPYLSPCLFPTCLLISLSTLRFNSSLWVLSVKGISLSPVPHFSLHCSVFFVLVALGTGLKSHLFWYSSLYFTLTCGCSLWVLPGHSMLLVLLFSPTRALTSLSLSLAVLLSRCLFGHMILSGSSFVLPCPRLFPPTCILNSFLIAAAAAWERTDFLASCVSP